MTRTRFGDDFDPVSMGRVESFTTDTLADVEPPQLHVRVTFMDGGTLVLRAVIGSQCTLDVRPVIQDRPQPGPT